MVGIAIENLPCLSLSTLFCRPVSHEQGKSFSVYHPCGIPMLLIYVIWLGQHCYSFAMRSDDLAVCQPLKIQRITVYFNSHLHQNIHCSVEQSASNVVWAHCSALGSSRHRQAPQFAIGFNPRLLDRTGLRDVFYPPRTHSWGKCHVFYLNLETLPEIR